MTQLHNIDIDMAAIKGGIEAADSSKRLLKTERFFHHHQSKIKYIQIAMLIAFLLLTIVPLFSQHPDASDSIFTSSILMSQFLFWGVWYGACLFSVIPLGRIWCGVLCPLGAVSAWAGKFGLKKSIPGWVRWNGWLVVMFTLITILGQTLDVRDDSVGLAKLFLYIFTLAIIIGFIFGQKDGRPWCRYYCPIGKILGVVSRLGMIDFRPPNRIPALPEGESHYIQGRLCPTDYNLPYKSDTTNCISCGQCAYGKEKAGLGLYWRKPGSEVGNILESNPNWSEIIFILASPGLSAGGFLWLILPQYEQYREMIGRWFIEHNYFWIFQLAPSWISSQTWNQHYNWLDVSLIILYIISYAVVIGLASTAIIAATAWALKSKAHSMKSIFVELVYQCIPIAILSIVIGLCGKFFSVMEHDFAMPEAVSMATKFILLLISFLWTIYLTWKIIRKSTKNTVRRVIAVVIMLLNVCMITYLWWPAILGHGELSEVEQIRQHIVVPE